MDSQKIGERLAITKERYRVIIENCGASLITARSTRRSSTCSTIQQVNNLGRNRMGADSSLRPVKSPRGLILSSGEDIPRGQSTRARMLVIELGPEDLDFERLSQCQRDAPRLGFTPLFARLVTQIRAKPYDFARLAFDR